jgi:hypothetical protein
LKQILGVSTANTKTLAQAGCNKQLGNQATIGLVKAAVTIEVSQWGREPAAGPGAMAAGAAGDAQTCHAVGLPRPLGGWSGSVIGDQPQSLPETSRSDLTPRARRKPNLDLQTKLSGKGC